MPIDQYNYQVEPPAISVKAATKARPAFVHITNTVTVTDGPEAGLPCQVPPGQPSAWQCWQVGLWSIRKTSAGYDVTFSPAPKTPHPERLSWTVTLMAEDMNVTVPAPEPTTDDDKGTLTWSVPPSDQYPYISASLDGPWQVRVNLASDRWSPRWFSDTSWTLDDDVVFDIVLIVFSLRLRRRWPKNDGRRRLANTVIGIAVFSTLCYAWYVGDDYVWHMNEFYGHSLSPDVVWVVEGLALAAASALYFAFALGAPWKTLIRKVTPRAVAVVVGLVLAFAVLMSLAIQERPPLPITQDGLLGFGWPRLAVEMIPLLLAITLANAGTVLWVSRMWPFGRVEGQGCLRPLSETSFSRRRPLIVLLIGMTVVSILIVGQSAASSYYYYLHSDLWSQGADAFTWIVSGQTSDNHWWIGDGIQWPLYFALFAGAFALLRAMSADARGVFFRCCKDENPSGQSSGKRAGRGDLVAMAALAGCLFVGTWGNYAGFWIPLPFIVTSVALSVWGYTRRLSVLDCCSKIKPLVSAIALERALASGAKDLRSAGGSSSRNSLLVEFRKYLLDASQRASAETAGKAATITPDPIVSAADAKPGSLTTEIPLEVAVYEHGPRDSHVKSLFGLELKGRVDPGVTALALGPDDNWWDNGIAAAKTGAYLAIGPIGFDVFITWNSGSLSLYNFPFGLQDIVGYVAETALSWIAGLFLFGALIPYLRGVRTPLKGVTFGLVAFAAFAADAGVRHALGVAPYPTYIVDGLLAVALFAATGLLLDLRTLQKYNDQELLARIYRLGSARVAVTLVTTLVVVGVSLWQAVYLTDQTAQQRAQNFSSAAQYTNQNLGNQ